MKGKTVIDSPELEKEIDAIDATITELLNRSLS